MENNDKQQLSEQGTQEQTPRSSLGRATQRFATTSTHQ